eukprot:978346-Amphidinium_carterae.2
MRYNEENRQSKRSKQHTIQQMYSPNTFRQQQFNHTLNGYAHHNFHRHHNQRNSPNLNHRALTPPTGPGTAIRPIQQRHNTSQSLSIDRGVITFTISWSSSAALALAVIMWMCYNSAIGSAIGSVSRSTITAISLFESLNLAAMANNRMTAKTVELENALASATGHAFKTMAEAAVPGFGDAILNGKWCSD